MRREQYTPSFTRLLFYQIPTLFQRISNVHENIYIIVDAKRDTTYDRSVINDYTNRDNSSVKCMEEYLTTFSDVRLREKCLIIFLRNFLFRNLRRQKIYHSRNRRKYCLARNDRRCSGIYSEYHLRAYKSRRFVAVYIYIFFL